MSKFTLKCSIKTLKSDNTKFEARFQVENISKEVMKEDSKGRQRIMRNYYGSTKESFDTLIEILADNHFGQPNNPKSKAYNCVFYTFNKNKIEDFKQNFQRLKGNTSISIEEKINGEELDSIDDTYMDRLGDKY